MGRKFLRGGRIKNEEVLVRVEINWKVFTKQGDCFVDKLSNNWNRISQIGIVGEIVLEI